MHIRDATEADLPAIVDIYNQSIPAGRSTADTAPVSVTDRLEWFQKFDPKKRPLWVAEIDGAIVAWIGLSSFYAGRPAYDATAEVSTYIANAYQKRGIGTLFPVVVEAVGDALRLQSDPRLLDGVAIGDAVEDDGQDFLLSKACVLGFSQV